jgi:hypothetical protein
MNVCLYLYVHIYLYFTYISVILPLPLWWLFTEKDQVAHTHPLKSPSRYQKAHGFL